MRAIRHVRLRCNSTRLGLGRSDSEGGLSLVEVLVATLLVAVMTSAVLSVALTAKTSGGQTDRKVVAGLATRQLSSQLKNMVTAYWDYSANNWYSGCSGGPPCANNDIGGPMNCPVGQTGACSWEWGKTPAGCAAAGTCVVDSCPAGAPCYALQAGAHVLSNYLPSNLENPPYNARICYYVCAPGQAGAVAFSCGPAGNATASCGSASFGGGGVSPSVSIAVNWTEP